MISLDRVSVSNLGSDGRVRQHEASAGSCRAREAREGREGRERLKGRGFQTIQKPRRTIVRTMAIQKERRRS